MNNGFINDNYILTAIEADCYGKKETFFIKAKKYDTEGFIMYIEFILAIENHFFGETKYEVCEKTSHKIPFDIESVTEYAKDYLGENKYYEHWNFKKDGASLISRLLFEEATDINFYVGKAINPAHQNPDLPINFNIKMNLVEELSQCLKLMGKRIKVSYF